MTWNTISQRPAPKDRVILVSNGWSWRRQDLHQKQLLRRNGEIIRDSADIPFRVIAGGAVLAYWEENTELPDGGAYCICGGKGLAPAFTFWMEIENPISQADANTHQINQIVSNLIPAAKDMPIYQPTEAETKSREIREMLRL